jgi:DNA-binding transcriptional regulator YiaG
MEPLLTPLLCREARALLDLDTAEVAFVARIPVSVLETFEAGHATPPPPVLATLRRIFERGGVAFRPERSRRGVELRVCA